MHTKRGRKTIRKYPQPRRTHNLGGCSTCRRRHVKCDQARPHCSVCRNARLQCEGFPSQIRWASTSTGPPAQKSARVHGKAPAAQAPSPQNTSERQDAALVSPGRPQPDERASSNAVHRDDEVPGPFSPTTSSPPHVGCQTPFHDSLSAATELFDHAPAYLPFVLPMGNVAHPGDDARHATNEPGLVSLPTTSYFSEIDSLLDNYPGLDWSDLFDPSMSLTMPTSHNKTYHDPMGVSAHVTSQPLEANSGLQYSEQLFSAEQDVVPFPTVLSPQPPPYTSRELDKATILENAKPLLQHFRDRVIPQFAPLPTRSKSPWEILNWSNAVHTLADMTFLQSSNVKHANIANLFAIMGCAAHSIAQAQIYRDDMSSQKVAQILDCASRQAKHHLQQSLISETGGPQKAKYKDQLMAILSLIALATLSGSSSDARSYIIDAERLLRLRGLAKRDVSRRARLLHHVYTWLRIVGESTFVLHNHNSSGLEAKIEAMIQNSKADTGLLPASKHNEVPAQEQIQLDDFLRIETHSTDNDFDVESSKDQETGLRDIHLADLRQWSNTLYVQIYGIPEAWLSLVSQTTRVANIIEFLDRTPSQPPRAFTDSLQRKTTQLEHMVCSFSTQHSISEGSPPLPIGNVDVAQEFSVASRSMLRAIGLALVVFFYRRIRNVHPFILQSHVNDIITALRDYNLAQGDANIKSPGTPWPAFIAGCEASSPSARDWLMDWLKNGAERSSSSGFMSAQAIMREVWEKRDAARLTRRSHSCTAKEAKICTWVDVVRESKVWLMLY